MFWSENWATGGRESGSADRPNVVVEPVAASMAAEAVASECRPSRDEENWASDCSG